MTLNPKSKSDRSIFRSSKPLKPRQKTLIRSRVRVYKTAYKLDEIIVNICASVFSRLLTKWRVRWWSWRWTSCPRTDRTCWKRSSWWTSSAIQTYSGESESGPLLHREKLDWRANYISLVHVPNFLCVVSRKRKKPEIWEKLLI